LDKDGYAEPCIITVHEKSKKVVRIVARYSPDTIMVKLNDRIESLTAAVERQAKVAMAAVSSGEQTALSTGFEVDFSGMKLCAVNPESQITSYSFYESLDGTFLGSGYFHMVANLATANNVTTNVLMDGAQLSTLGGGFLAKGFRKKMGPIRLKLGQWMATDVPAADLRNGMMPNPTSEPSQTLYNLNDKIEGQLRNFTLVAGNENQGIQANTAPTTALAMISEQAIPTSALLLRITEAEGKEFQKLFQLNKKYVDPEQYQMVLDDEEANFENDFNEKMMDMVPVANPEMSSKMQRVQMAEAQMGVVDRVLQAGGNPMPIIKGYFEAMGADNLDKIFPEEGTMTEEEKQQIAAMTQAQEQANELQTIQIQLLNQQVENEGIEAKSLAQRRSIENRETVVKIDKIIADTILTREEAETESLKNQIDTYTAQMTAIRDSIPTGMPGQEQAAETVTALSQM